MNTNDDTLVQNFEILCDTNIFIDLTHKSLRVPLVDFLSNIQKKKNSFCYSHYSIFELFRGQSKKLVQNYQEILDLFKGIPINDNILMAASQLMSLYKHAKIVTTGSTNKQKNPNKIDDGDYILAATAILHKNTALLTRNYQDFPRPFFNEIHKHYLEYEVDGKKGLEVYYILEPDFSYASKLYKLMS